MDRLLNLRQRREVPNMVEDSLLLDRDLPDDEHYDRYHGKLKQRDKKSDHVVRPSFGAVEAD